MFYFLKNLFCSFLNVVLIAICHLFLVLCKAVSVGATESKEKHNWNGKKLKLVHVVGKFIYKHLLNKYYAIQNSHYCIEKRRYSPRDIN